MKDGSKKDLIRNKFFKTFNLERSTLSKKIIRNANQKNLKKVSNLRFMRENNDTLFSWQRQKRNYGTSGTSGSSGTSLKKKKIDIFENVHNYENRNCSSRQMLANYLNANFFNILNPFMSTQNNQGNQGPRNIDLFIKASLRQNSKQHKNDQKKFEKNRQESVRVYTKDIQKTNKFSNDKSAFTKAKMDRTKFNLIKMRSNRKLKAKFINDELAEETHPIHKLIHNRIGKFYSFGFRNKSLKFFYQNCSPVRYYSKRNESKFNIYNGITTYQDTIRKLNLNKTQS